MMANQSKKVITIDEVKKQMDEFSNVLKEAEKNEAVLSGRLQEVTKSIKEQFGVDSIDPLKKKKIETEKEVEKLKESIIQKFTELQGAYQW